MTVVPDEDLLQLICDNCGETEAGPAPVLPDAEVVWTFLSEHHWSGSPFASGPHRCPRCALAPPPGGRAARPETERTGQGRERTGHGTERTGHGGGVLGVEQIDGVMVVTVAGDIDVVTGDELHQTLSAAVATGRGTLVDLTRVHFIDSPGLGLLVRAHRQAKEHGGQLCLAAPSRFIRTVLHTMRLGGVFPIFDSRQEALRRLSPADDETGRIGAADASAADAPDVLSRSRS